jgi:lysozyme
MFTNQAGVELIKEFEGLRLRAYRCPAGVATIGYGTTVYPTGYKVQMGEQITAEQAEEYLRSDLRAFERDVERMVRVPLNTNQFAALVSFAYNLGAEALRKSTLLRLLNAHNYAGAAEQFARWTYAAGKQLPGLVRRRAAERALFIQTDITPAVNTPPASVPDVGDFPPMQPVAALHVEQPMAPIVAALMPSLISAIPEIAKLFGSGPRTDKTAAIAQKVAETVIAATNTANLQAAVETVQADPQMRKQATEAVQAMWYELQEIGGGISAAREFSARTAADGASFIRMPAFWISLALLPLLYGTVYAVLTGGDGFTSELRAAIASSVVTGVLGAVAGFWLGSSFTTSRSRGLGATPISDQP